MNPPKKCAKPSCGKTVYPMEELKCLDKVWHKGCFRCTVCNMALSMKNYKGFDKMPYCEAHYPKTVATVSMDTPEMRRLAENTKNQSLVQYHAEFEKMKGQKTDVSIDDPEMQRNMRNMKVVSQAAYHHDVERKAEMEQTRPPLEQNSRDNNGYQSGVTSGSAFIGGNNDGALIYTNNQPPHGAQSHGVKPPGRIDDYDPMNGQWGSATSKPLPFQSQQPQQDAVRSPTGTQSTAELRAEAMQQSRQMSHPSQLSPRQQQEELARQVQQTTISTNREYMQNSYGQTAPAPVHVMPSTSVQPMVAKTVAPPVTSSTGTSFRAVYDYTAADVDEVTFVEGDLIVNTKSVDEGWMTGTVQRTSQWGMLPANYVERAN